MRGQWWRRALQQRLATLAAAALILWTIGTAVAASIATDRMADAIAGERRREALAIARQIDRSLDDALRQLDLVAGASSAPAEAAQLPAHVRGLRLAESVLRLSATGDVLWARSVADGAETDPPIGAVPHPAGGPWRAQVTEAVQTSRGTRAFLVLPARESDPVGGALAAVIDPGSAFDSILSLHAGGPYRVELQDETRRTIAESRAAAGAADAGADLTAAAPVSNGRWQLRLVQPRAEVLAPVLQLRRVLVGSSLLLLPFAVMAAVATARSIRRPVLTMTDAAERLARGERAAPIPAAGEDEIGRLAAALEQLRRALEGDERRSVLLKRVISAQEEERRRIARELHDETMQQLSALALQLESIAASRPEASAALARSHTLVRSMIDDLHRVIHGLRPAILDDLGLLPAIRAYAEAHLTSRGIEVHVEFPDSLPGLSKEAAIALYRVVQEALTNVARHARADTVLIGCTVSDVDVVFEIEDDGAGFDPLTIQRPRETGEGLGLLGMRERLALLGGRVEIESEPRRGTRVLAVLPLDAHVDRA